jgi:putative FmdB family regulatory protein
MPLYEYECDACHQRFERIQKFSDPPLDVCPKCGKGPVRKLVSSPAIQFKGSGWYITDYARKSGTESSNKAGTTSSESSSTTSATDTAAASADKSQKSSDKTEKKP